MLGPGLEGGSTEVDAVDEELQGFGREFDAALAGFTRGGPAEKAFLQAFRRYPKTGAVEVEELDAVAAFVGEDEEGVAGGGGLELGGPPNAKPIWLKAFTRLILLAVVQRRRRELRPENRSHVFRTAEAGTLGHGRHG